ncbi:PaaI family thioesterase [Gordonia sp. 'Campus']|uniref:PaaI family thioesterase n=1 Tax=Gordonia sp. 'Campus' TaxID=2915824 RepID=UPI001EE40124|nr:PaaI family thioesterase [Gordonia sp. 'Campus']
MQPCIVMSTSADTATDPTALSGLELLRAWQAGGAGADRPSIGRLLGMVPKQIDEGSVTFAVTPQPDFANPLGTVHGGICATLLDSVMGCAVHTTLPAGVGYTTLELKVNYIRSVAVDAGELTGVGTVIHAGRTTATAEGKVFSHDGKLVAHGTTTCIVFR